MRLVVPTLLGMILMTFGAASTGASAPSFHTPSGNIGCIAFSGHLRCDIGQKDWRSPVRPAGCPLAFGDSFTLSKRGWPIWTCHGDTVLHQGRSLAYGKTWRSGPFTCRSRVTGLSCSNRTGHGFFLSRQTYRIF
jgi:hypothetical protein